MKATIHPIYYSEAEVTCSCGNSFKTGSTLPKITVEICSACHPFYTGEMKFVDTQGRVEKFQAARDKAIALQKDMAKKQNDKAGDQVDDNYQPKTLKEMMQDIAQAQKASTKKAN